MEKKIPLLLRTLYVALTLFLAIGLTAPMASALTPGQERALQSDQRSINNPEGTFALPRPGFIPQLVQGDSLAAGQMMVANALRQMLTGNADPEFTQIMAYAPVVKAGDPLPPRRDLSFPAVLKAILMEGMNNLYIALMETGQPGHYDIIAFYVDWKGNAFWSGTGIEYDAKAGYIQSADDKGVILSFDFDMNNYVLRNPRDHINKIFGFNIIFDIASPLVLMHLDTLRFPFEYNGKDYMLQFWKGSYFLITNGGEVGIYEKPSGRPIQWDASDTELEMTMQLYQKDELFFEFGPYRTWWAAAFRYGNPVLMPIRTPKNLRLTGTILFEDQAMLDAFLASFEANRPANMTGQASGLLFEYDWQVG